MRKFLALAATVILGGALLIAGCGNDNNKQAANNGKQVLKIGATAVPHAEILEQVKPILAKDGIDLEYGARPLKRSIQNNLENELSELILQQVIKAGDDVVADVKDDKMIFTVQ